MNQKKKTKPRPNTQKAVREYTAGGVVYRYHGGGIQLLMIQDRQGRWSIPKGHVEEGESLEQTALREVSEETGLQKLKIRQRLDKIHFFYRMENRLIFMTTHVFLMEAVGDAHILTPEDSEGIADARWFDFDQAMALVEYKDTARLFEMGLAKLVSK